MEEILSKLLVPDNAIILQVYEGVGLLYVFGTYVCLILLCYIHFISHSSVVLHT